MKTKILKFNNSIVFGRFYRERERECFYPAPFGRGKIRSGWKQEETRILDKRCGVYLSEKKSASDNSSFQPAPHQSQREIFVTGSLKADTPYGFFCGKAESFVKIGAGFVIKNGNLLQFFVADFLLFKSSQQYVGGIKVENHKS